MNGLVLHCGATEFTRAELINVTTPTPTSSWKPVPHSEVAEMVYGHCKEAKLEIIEERYGVTGDGSSMFGFLRFQRDGHPEYQRCMGFRNNNKKQFALGISIGFSVLICDNMCLSGENVLKRRHTANLDVQMFVSGIFNQIEEKYQKLDMNIERLKNQSISMDNARLAIVKAAEEKAINSSDIISILDEFQSPRHQEFQGNTRWSLMNSFTEIGKKYHQPKSQFFYNRLSSIFDLDGDE